MTIVNIDVSHDKVVIEGVSVPRPHWIAASIWMRYWEDVRKGTYEEGYARGYNDGSRDADEGHRR
jgi:hypothetical protein